MIVVDSSALLELLLNSTRGRRLQPRFFSPEQIVCAPHLVDVEVAQVLRRYAWKGEVDPERCDEALSDLSCLPIHRYPHSPLLPRIWMLRRNLTAYDAVYVALAEMLNAPLVTADRRLTASPGHAALIELL